jgi:hypothetical protein
VAKEIVMQDGNILWRGTASARWPVYLGLGFIVAAVTGNYVWMLLIVAGLAVLSLTSITVEISRDALTVRYYGGARWPATRIPLSEVREVAVVEVNPSASGGWGYRGSLRLFGRAAVILRRGPGLRLLLDGGRRFLVTVDNPEGAVQILQQLVAPS